MCAYICSRQPWSQPLFTAQVLGAQSPDVWMFGLKFLPVSIELDLFLSQWTTPS